jgi:hypothetical protein
MLPTDRYASFDYCFNYFQSFRESKKLFELTDDANLEKSCLQIGFYLASWGMLRGSSELLQKCVKHYIPLIELISQTKAELWEIDLDCYDNDNIEKLLEQNSAIQKAVRGARTASNTLSTKIMLGVFGSIPAFDEYFKLGFETSSLNKKSLYRVSQFYADNEEVFRLRIPTIEFSPKREGPNRYYTKAKLLDMIFFTEGYKISNAFGSHKL